MCYKNNKDLVWSEPKKIRNFGTCWKTFTHENTSVLGLYYDW